MPVGAARRLATLAVRTEALNYRIPCALAGPGSLPIWRPADRLPVAPAARSSARRSTRLAGMSPEYRARLEQGRARNLSSGILEALGTGTVLDAAEREHVNDLCTRAGSVPGRQAHPCLRLERLPQLIPGGYRGSRRRWLEWIQVGGIPGQPGPGMKDWP
jgi:hypothetical protein